MSASVVLEWTFSPSDFFEEPIEISYKDYTMTIANGKVQVKIDPVVYEANPSVRQQLHDDLNNRFLAVQLFTHRAYQLSRPTISRVHSDGHRDIFLEANLSARALTGTVDFQITNKEGQLIFDSKRDRINRKKTIAELIIFHRADELMATLLQSYDRAVRDPNNELVYLFDIRDALSTKFNGENAAKLALGISSSQWSRLGHLCNDEQLKQGRHRGKAGGALRDASNEELTEARGIARAMIEAYLQNLESSTNL